MRTTTPVQPRNVTFTPIASDYEPQSDDGSNNTTNDQQIFEEQIGTMILANLSSFTVNDAFNLSRGFDWGGQNTKRFFQLWTRKMVKAGRIQLVPSLVYDDSVFEVV